MKFASLICCVVAAALFPSHSAADIVPNDEYFIAPGLGNTNGFFFSASGLTDAVFDGTADLTGIDLFGGNITTNESTTDNLDGTSTVLIEMATDGTDLFPSGFSDGTDPLDLAGFFLGASGGGNPLDFDAPAILAPGGPFGIGAALVGLDSTGGTVFGFDVSSFGNFTAGAGGGWDGNLGVNLGNQVGQGVTTVQLFVTLDNSTVPEPSSLALFAIAATGFCLRRRAR